MKAPRPAPRNTPPVAAVEASGESKNDAIVIFAPSSTDGVALRSIGPEGSSGPRCDCAACAPTRALPMR